MYFSFLFPNLSKKENKLPKKADKSPNIKKKQSEKSHQQDVANTKELVLIKYAFSSSSIVHICILLYNFDLCHSFKITHSYTFLIARVPKFHCEMSILFPTLKLKAAKMKFQFMKCKLMHLTKF